MVIGKKIAIISTLSPFCFYRFRTFIPHVPFDLVQVRHLLKYFHNVEVQLRVKRFALSFEIVL